MILKSEDISGALEMAILIGYARLGPTAERLKDNIKDVISMLRHPVAYYIVHLEEKVSRNLDYWEGADLRIKREQRYREV